MRTDVRVRADGWARADAYLQEWGWDSFLQLRSVVAVFLMELGSGVRNEIRVGARMMLRLRIVYLTALRRQR